MFLINKSILSVYLLITSYKKQLSYPNEADISTFYFSCEPKGEEDLSTKQFTAT